MFRLTTHLRLMTHLQNLARMSSLNILPHMSLLLQIQFVTYPCGKATTSPIDGTGEPAIVVDLNGTSGVFVHQVLNFQHDMAEILQGASDIIEDIPLNETVTLIATVCRSGPFYTNPLLTDAVEAISSGKVGAMCKWTLYTRYTGYSRRETVS